MLELAVVMPEEQKPATTVAPPVAAVEKVEPKAKVKEVELDATKIHVKLYSPFKTYFDADAKSISAENDTGPFDVLPQHHNFITLLNACEILIMSLEGKEMRIQITKGVMHVRNNKVTVFLDV